MPPGLARRCVVKASYVSLARGGIKAARVHLAYIERDGVERDGSPGRMFDAAGDVRRAEFGVPIEGEKRQFRFIIAPEDGDELDLRDYTRRLVDRMEKDLGRGLRWAAVCHYDTDNPHVHMVVRGVDTQDREVRIDRTYLSESLRQRAQELATNELGPRNELEVQQQLDREVRQERLTTIDRRLAALAPPDLTIRIADITTAADSGKLSRSRAIARLDVLERLQLAERVSPSSWRLDAGWQGTLKRLGERGDIIKRMHQALPQRAADYRIFEANNRGSIEGIVRHKGLHDEQTGAPFLIIETSRKEAHYVRTDQRDAEQLRVGERVRVSAVRGRWLTAPDVAIARAAAEHRGTCDPQQHQRELILRPVTIDGRRVPPEAVVEANVRRLERLERYNLVTRNADGSWKVPPSLVDILRDRERTHPQHRIEIQPLDRAPERGRSRGRDLGR
jgi:type IV secretory pathway VirD2 relaxase